MHILSNVGGSWLFFFTYSCFAFRNTAFKESINFFISPLYQNIVFVSWSLKIVTGSMVYAFNWALLKFIFYRAIDKSEFLKTFKLIFFATVKFYNFPLNFLVR
jgi:hypothetical protein